MDDSQPLRRSTRNSVALKNEELTPRKRKVSTPVKVEPSTPSRRTRASSATPKKSLIEVMNTPKKTLPVLNEEENAAGSLRTPSKRSKEISPKTPIRRRTVRESVSTPKSTKKSVDTSEEINVVTNRPLTRAKRKTMGEIQAEEVIKASELEKVVQNKKELNKSTQNKKEKATVSKIDDKKLEESCFAAVPRVVITDIKNEQLKEEKKSENIVQDEDECGTFKTKSPVKAEDVAINSPRKVPENCKSSSEASLRGDSEYVKSRSREIMVDPSDLPSPVENTDLSCAGNTDISSHDQQANKYSISDVMSPKKVTDSRNNEVSDVVPTSLPEDTDSKDNKVSDTVTTSPLKDTDSDIKVSDTVTTSPLKDTESDIKVSDTVTISPLKDTDSDIKVSDSVSTSPHNDTDLKDVKVSDNITTSPTKDTDLKDIEVSDNVTTSPTKDTDLKDHKVSDNVTASSQEDAVSKDKKVSVNVTTSPQKLTDSNDVPNIVITAPSPHKVMNSKDNNVPNIVITSPSPKKSVPLSGDGSDCSSISEQKTSPTKNELNSSTVNSDVKNTDEIELSKEETSVKADVKNSNQSDEKTLDKIENELTSKKINETNEEMEVFENDDKKCSVEEIDDNGKAMIQSDVSTVSPSKTDSKDKETEELKLSSTSLTIQEDEDIIFSNNVSVENVINDENEKNSVQAAVQVSSVVEMDTDAAMTVIENKESKELNKTFDKAEPDQLVLHGDNDITAKDVCISGSDSKVVMDENNTSEMVADGNEAVIKDDMLPNSGETNESKLINTSDESSRPGSSCLDECTVENNSEEVCKITSAAMESAMDVENEEDKKDDKSTTDEASPSGSSDKSCSPKKVCNTEDVSIRVTDEDKKESGNTKGADETHNNSEGELDGASKKERKETADKSSPVKSNDASFPMHPDRVENELIADQRIDEGLDVAGPSSRVENDDNSTSPLIFVKSDSDASDSGDSGIQNDDKVLVIKVSSKLKKHMLKNENFMKGLPLEDFGPENDVSRPGNPDAERSDNIEANSGAVLEDENKGEVSGSDSSVVSVVILTPEKSDVELSSEKSDVNSDGNAENDSSIPSAINDDTTDRTTENIPKASESTEDCTSKITGLDAILMSPKDFLNSDEECYVDVEKIEDPQPKNESENSKSSEESVNIADDNLEHSVPESQECFSSNTDVNSDPTSEDSSTKVDENKDDNNEKDVSAKSAADEVETRISTAVLCDDKTKTIPFESEITNGVDNTCVEKEKEEISSQQINISKNSSIVNTSEDNQICENKSSSPSADISARTNSSQPSDSIKENKREVKKTEINERDNLNSSQSVGSPEIDVEKLSEDEKSTIESETKVVNSVKEYDLSDADRPENKTTPESLTKNIKYNKNRRKNANKKIESETDDSESDVNSELSSSPPSNVATEGSSDGPLCGKDFIEFEAEEGEETSEDDSFIVSSGDSTASSSSSSPRFAMKLRKRKRSQDTESSDSCNYIDSVQRLFDSSIDFSKDDGKEDSPIINKKQKLEKSITVNKKNKRPKSSTFGNKHTVVESEGNRNKIKTGSKVIKEFSKTGVFIVSSVDQHFEEPKLSRNSSKRSSKLRMEQKKSEITVDNYVPNGFSVSDAYENLADDAALRGFVVSYDDSHLVTKKPRKAGIGSSDFASRKKKFNEGKNFKKTLKKSNTWELKEDNKNETFVVSLVLPFSMTSRSVSSVLADIGLSDVSSINFCRPRVAVVEFSKKESFKKILKLYGELKINDRPIYILEGSSAP